MECCIEWGPFLGVKPLKRRAIVFQSRQIRRTHVTPPAPGCHGKWTSACQGLRQGCRTPILAVTARSTGSAGDDEGNHAVNSQRCIRAKSTHASNRLPLQMASTTYVAVKAASSPTPGKRSGRWPRGPGCLADRADCSLRRTGRGERRGARGHGVSRPRVSGPESRGAARGRGPEWICRPGRGFAGQGREDRGQRRRWRGARLRLLPDSRRARGSSPGAPRLRGRR